MRTSLLRWAGLALLAPLGLATLVGQTPLVIRNGILLDGTGAPPVQDAVLVIKGDRILSAGPRQRTPIPRGARVLDAGGGTILPGFINAHVHHGYQSKNLEAWAQGGVTTVRDLGIFNEPRPLKELLAFRDAKRSDPSSARIISAGYMLAAPGGYGALYAGSPEEARIQARMELDAGVELLKVSMEDGYAGTSGLPKLSPATLKAIVGEAHARGVKVSGHITQGRFVAPLLDAGVDDIAHTAYTPIPDEVLQRMAKSRVFLVPTFTIFRNFHAPLEPCIDNVRRFLAAGGRVVLGNDFGGGPGDFETGIPHYEIACMSRAGMTPMQIIQAATGLAAEASGVGRLLGTLVPGRQADVLVVKGDPLADLAALASIRFVLHSGRVIRDTP